jgi:hypothetical protein
VSFGDLIALPNQRLGIGICHIDFEASKSAMEIFQDLTPAARSVTSPDPQKTWSQYESNGFNPSIEHVYNTALKYQELELLDPSLRSSTFRPSDTLEGSNVSSELFCSGFALIVDLDRNSD